MDPAMAGVVAATCVLAVLSGVLAAACWALLRRLRSTERRMEAAVAAAAAAQCKAQLLSYGSGSSPGHGSGATAGDAAALCHGCSGPGGLVAAAGYGLRRRGSVLVAGSGRDSGGDGPPEVCLMGTGSQLGGRSSIDDAPGNHLDHDSHDSATKKRQCAPGVQPPRPPGRWH